MKNSKIFFLSCLIPILFSGCVVGKLFQDTTIKRYRSAELIDLNDTANTEPQKVEITIFSTKASQKEKQSSKKSLWDLEGKGEAKLIQVIGEKSKTTSEFFANLERDYMKPQKQYISDYSEQKLTMILSISKIRNYSKLNKGYAIADRIEYLKIKLNNKNSGMHFLKWNKFQTEYGTVNIGDVTFNESLSVSAGLNGNRATNKTKSFLDGNDSMAYGASGSFSPSLSLTGSTSSSETQSINQRYISLNGKLEKNTLEVEQEGIREIDLAGNVIIDVQMKFDSLKKEPFFTFQNFSKGGIPILDISKTNINKTDVILPEYRKIDSIYLSLNFEYVYRHVLNKRGAKTFFEWDDRVRYFKENVSNDRIVILNPKDYLPKFYYAGIYDFNDSKYPNIGLFLKDQYSFDLPYPLQAFDEKELKEFIDFLFKKSKEIQSNHPDYNNQIEFKRYTMVSQRESQWDLFDSEYKKFTWSDLHKYKNYLFIKSIYEFNEIPTIYYLKD